MSAWLQNNRRGIPKWIQCYNRGKVSLDPQKWLPDLRMAFIWPPFGIQIYDCVLTSIWNHMQLTSVHSWPCIQCIHHTSPCCPHHNFHRLCICICICICICNLHICLICNRQVSAAGAMYSPRVPRLPQHNCHHSCLCVCICICLCLLQIIIYAIDKSTSVHSWCNVFTARPPPPSSAFFVAHNICPSDIFLLRPWSTHK